jgi:regulator of RNase E activity RraA
MDAWYNRLVHEMGPPPPGSADVSDACDDLGIPAARVGGFRPMWPGCPPLFGRVRTLCLTPGESADPVSDVLTALTRCDPGDVALVDLGGRSDLQCWGGRTALAAAQAGVSGALVNGAVRDVATLRGMGSATFALGTYPARAAGRLRYRGTDLDVRLGAVTVRSGSAVVADDDGAVFFPFASLHQVTARARALAVND